MTPDNIPIVGSLASVNTCCGGFDNTPVYEKGELGLILRYDVVSQIATLLIRARREDFYIGYIDLVPCVQPTQD